MNDDMPMCERNKANHIQSGDYQNQNSHDTYFHQSHHDLNDSEKSLTELNNDVKNDLKDFKSCIRSMRTIHDKLFDRDDQSKTDLKKSITKFLDGQSVSNMFVKNNINDIIIKMKQNEKNCQTINKNMERKIDEWSKSQNVSSEHTDRTDPPPPPPQAQTEQPRFFCLTGEVPSFTPSLCLASILGTPVMSAGFQENTSSCGGAVIGRTIWISSGLALSLTMVAIPACVGNFIIPSAVEETTPRARIPGHPMMPLYYEGDLPTKKFIHTVDCADDYEVILNVHVGDRGKRYAHLWQCMYYRPWTDISSLGLDHEYGGPYIL
ncbi:hypothetical protein Tco_1561863 [Tanacetum coccineum]